MPSEAGREANIFGLLSVTSAEAVLKRNLSGTLGRLPRVCRGEGLDGHLVGIFVVLWLGHSTDVAAFPSIFIVVITSIVLPHTEPKGDLFLALCVTSFV